MKMLKGFISPLLAIGVLIVGTFLLAVVFGPKVLSNFGILSLRKENQVSQAADKNIVSEKQKKASPSPHIPITPRPSVLPSPIYTNYPSPSSAGTSTVYSQPQGKYKLTLPSGWSVNAAVATTTYSSTRFTSSIGYVAITFGSGKDPLGGCSETSSIVLADRTINGCLLLQKDGSQILTRGYTIDSAGIQFTIEAFFNSPSLNSRPIILDVVKTIDIN